MELKKKLLYLSAFLCAITLISLGISTDTSRAADGSKLVIAYSNNVEGYLEPCG
jgi:hypothetical protein